MWGVEVQRQAVFQELLVDHEELSNKHNRLEAFTSVWHPRNNSGMFPTMGLRISINWISQKK
jgi:hypothetical protein